MRIVAIYYIAIMRTDVHIFVHRFSSFLQQYCILLQEMISTCAVRKMAAQRVSGNNNRTVTIQVLARNTPSGYMFNYTGFPRSCNNTVFYYER